LTHWTPVGHPRRDSRISIGVARPDLRITRRTLRCILSGPRIVEATADGAPPRGARAGGGPPLLAQGAARAGPVVMRRLPIRSTEVPATPRPVPAGPAPARSGTNRFGQTRAWNGLAAATSSDGCALARPWSSLERRTCGWLTVRGPRLRHLTGSRGTGSADRTEPPPPADRGPL
jgi:hypothetical protein